MANGTVVQSFALRHVGAEDVLEVARPHLGLAPGEMIGIDVSVSADVRGQHLYVTGVEDKVKLLEGLIKSIDQPEESLTESTEPSELRRHLVEGGNVDTVYNVLQTLLAGRDVRLSVDVPSSSIVAFAPPSTQNEISQTVMQLQAAEAEFEVIPLRTADPYFVISLLEEMLDLPSAFADPDEIDPNTPKIDADPANGRLFVRAKRPQLEQIKTIVKGLDGVGASADSGSQMPGDQTRMLPLKGQNAMTLLEAASKFWRGENPVVLYKPVTRDERPRERVLTNPQGGSGESSRNQETKEPRRSLPKLGESASWSVNPRNDSGVRSQEVGAPERWLTANTESDGPVIRCQLLPDGLVIQCEDTDALDQFESYLQSMSGSFGSTVSPTIVFYLKYAKADDTVCFPI